MGIILAPGLRALAQKQLAKCHSLTMQNDGIGKWPSGIIQNAAVLFQTKNKVLNELNCYLKGKNISYTPRDLDDLYGELN